MKIVKNDDYGGFHLSSFACRELEKAGISEPDEFGYGLDRDDPELVRLLETYGEKLVCRGSCTLKIVEIPDEATDWDINDYDGAETVVYVLNGKLNYA